LVRRFASARRRRGEVAAPGGRDGESGQEFTPQWQRAVFLGTGSSVVGLVADDVRLLGRTDLHVVPFTPLGTPPTRFGHLFNAAWVDGQRVTLVLDPNGLIGFLRGLGGTA